MTDYKYGDHPHEGDEVVAHDDEEARAIDIAALLGSLMVQTEIHLLQLPDTQELADYCDLYGQMVEGQGLGQEGHTMAAIRMLQTYARAYREIQSDYVQHRLDIELGGILDGET